MAANAGSWSISGTTASYKVGSTVVAKITGLASGLAAADLNTTDGVKWIKVTEPDTSATPPTSGTITLPATVLGTGAKMSLSGSGDYKLATSGITEIAIPAATMSTSSGKATFTATVPVGYKQTDDKTIIYNATSKTTTVATVSGLASSVPDGVVSESGGVVTLKLDAFNKKKVTISSGYGYKLALDTTDAEYTAGTDGATDTLGGKDGTAAWTVSGTTATYKQTRSAKYTLAADGKSVAYTAAKTATLATVKGLAKGLTAAKVTTGITGTDSDNDKAIDGDLTLSKDMLGTTHVTLTVGKKLDGTAANYVLKLDKANIMDGDDTEVTNGTQIWAVSGTTATYKTVTPAHYKEDSATKITYTAQKDVEKLATVKGLAKGLKTGTDATKLYASDGTTEVATAATYSASLTSANKGAITVKFGALNTTNATITSDVYKLALTDSATEGEKVTAPTITPTWSVSGTTATLKGKVTAGWELSTDGSKITYTKASTGTKLATVKGLATGLTNGTIGNAISVSVDANGKVKKDSGVATITLKAAALGTKDISLSGSNYKLALDSNDATIVKSIYDSANSKFNPPTEKPTWAISGTTATYKTVTPAYYQEDSDTKISYKAQEDKTDGTIATVTGLKAGLALGTGTNEGKIGAMVSSTWTDYVSISGAGTSESPYKIQLTAPALTTTPVELTFGKDTTKGVLYLYGTDTATETTTALKVTAPILENKTWAVSETDDTSTTAEYKATATAGWALNADANAVNYTPNSSGMVLAKVTGLKGNLTDIKLNGDTTVTPAVAAGITVDGSEITLTNAVVGTNEIAISEGNYTFKQDSNVVMAAAPNATAMWYIDPATPTTAKYQNVTGKYFTYKTGTTDKKTLTYNAPAVAATPNLQATITGLASGLVVDGDNTDKIVDAEGKDAIVLASNKLTVYKPALNPDGQTVELDSSTFSFETLDTYSASNTKGVIAPEVTYSLTYDADAGTATLSQGTTEGYSIDTDKKKIVYTAFKSSAEDAAPTKIKGLATGLDEADVIGADGTGGYITYDGTAKTITLARAVLGDTAVEFDGTSTYTFKLADTSTPAATVGWKTTKVDAATGTIATTTAELFAANPATYALDGDKKKVERTAPAITGTTVLATVTGLKSGLSAVETAIEGIELVDTDGDDNADVIKLSNNVLAGSTSAVATLETTGSYVLALDTMPATGAVEGYNYVPSSDAVNTFSIASGTLTYTTTNPAGYALSTDSKTVTYTDEMVDKTTIAGLKSSLNISEKEVAVTVGSDTPVTLTSGITLTAPKKGTAAVVDGSGNITTPAVDDTPGTFNIGSKAVGKKDITLTNDVGNSSLVSGDFDYNIALDGVTAQTVNAPVWNKTNKTTTATYTQTFAKGYTQTDDEHIVYASKNTKKTYATLTGLNKDVMANADGTINGITIALGASVTTASAGSNATVVSGDVITLSDPNLFTTTNITLGKTDNYYLAVAEGFGSASAAAHWSLAKGTAKVVTGMTEGWQIKETVKNGTTNYENKTIEYKKADETSKPEYTLATVTGLNSALELNDDGTIDGLEFDTTNHNITVSEAAVTTGTVTVAGTSYTLVMGDGIGLPEAEEPEWVVNKGTATYQYDVSEGWKFNSTETPTSMTYQAAKTEKTAVVLTTITGLNPALEAAGTDIAIVDDKYELSSDGTEYVGISSIEKGTIELSAKALEGTKTVKFKDKNSVYQFKLADDVYAEGVANTNLTEDQNADEWKDQDGWVTNGTTANYKTGYHKEHYKFGTDGSIAVVAATKGDDVATVKNIKKDSTITDQNGLITLTSANLDGKTVTLTSTVAGYALALDTTGISNGDIVESKYINKKWETKGNKANLTGTLTTGYKTSADGKSITYTTKNTSTTIATVTGIKNNVNIKDCVDESTGEITLSKAQLDGKAVTLTNTANLGYTLKLGDDVAAPVIDKTSIEWAVKGDTATLTGKTTAGYTVAPDAQSIAYTAATASNKVATLATIKGINQPIETTLPDLLKAATNDTTGTITLRNELLAQATTANATVDGKNLFAFEFAADYSNKKVTGTTASDKLTVTGSGVQVEGGKGNDNIDFGGAGGNTLVYASGDGDDVVVNFTDSDIIKSEKSVITGDNIKTVVNDDDEDGIDDPDVLVTIGKNTITLKDYSGSTLTITDKSGTTTYESQDTNPFWTTPTADSASNVLLADNNYSADAAALSDIVEPFKASYTPYDFEGGLDLVKKDSFAPAITYTGTDKK